MAMEFSQIDRSELGRLQSYFAASKIKVGEKQSHGM